MNAKLPFWAQPPEQVFKELNTSAQGLSKSEAFRRLAEKRKAAGHRPLWWSNVALLLRQFNNPLVLLLVFAVILSSALGEIINSVIILGILLLSGIMGFWQEHHAGRAVRKLQEMVLVKVRVRRNGATVEIDLEAVVPGDIVELSAGDIVPGDCLLLEGTDLHLNEAALTGETFPVEKEPGICPVDAELAQRTNALYQGTTVMSGAAIALVVASGKETEFGRIAGRMQSLSPETAYESGIRKFGYLLMRLTFILSAGLLIFNLFAGRPMVASIIFAISLAVGLAPELLPAIVVTASSAGAERLSREKVIVKKLNAIQNLGAIDVLCSDKTGTLTTGQVQVQSTLGVDGLHSEAVRRYAYLNAVFETGFINPLDEAIRKIKNIDVAGYSKCDEVPYDFNRKRLSIVVENKGRHLMLTKGALAQVLEVCTRAELPDGSTVPLSDISEKIEAIFQAQSREGYRTIGLAIRDVTGDPVIDQSDEQEMTFLGFLFLYDPPRPDVLQTKQDLQNIGVHLKIITGDNHLAAQHLSRAIGGDPKKQMTGAQVEKLSEEALARKAITTDVFSEIEPFQKERIIRALQRAGATVGYLGDGINDAAALKASDVGISVDTAVAVAKEAADIVLLEKNLSVLKAGILEGRRTYLNTLKYIFITTSANFGNMFSLAGISLFIPFLPLLPMQILLINFLSDIPALAISSDHVDEELLRKPKKWDLKLIRNFMVVFGIQSSIFDYLTFAALLWWFHVGEAYFQTSWFVESVLTEIVILLIIRTRHPFFRSKPSKWLLWISITMVAITLLMPYIPWTAYLGFKPLPPALLLSMAGIASLYGLLSEFTKRRFYKQML